MTEKRYFMGIDMGRGVSKSVGCLMEVEGEKIGVLTSFEVNEERDTQPIFKLPEGIYEIPESARYEVGLLRVEVNEGALREILLDCEYNKAPPREVFP
jgi:hypothetical protein